MKALEVVDLKKSFTSNFLLRRFEILKGINLQVDRGEIYGFLGPNGAGKTTTMKCVMGLLSPDSGTIRIQGQLSDKPKTREKLGFLPEHPYFYDYLSGPELLRFSARLFSIPRRVCESKIYDLIRLVGLENTGGLKLRKFSKGMIQRIGLAQALINDPDLVLLDEPFSGLDPVGRKELRDIILGLRDTGKTVFLSSHILQDLEMIADKVGIIFEGRIIKEGSLSELISESVRYFETVFTGMDEDKIRAMRLDVSRQGRNFLLSCMDVDGMNATIEVILASGGKIISVTPFKRTLEDIFLEEIKE